MQYNALIHVRILMLFIISDLTILTFMANFGSSLGTQINSNQSTEINISSYLLGVEI